MSCVDVSHTISRGFARLPAPAGCNAGHGDFGPASTRLTLQTRGPCLRTWPPKTPSPRNSTSALFTRQFPHIQCSHVCGFGEIFGLQRRLFAQEGCGLDSATKSLLDLGNSGSHPFVTQAAPVDFLGISEEFPVEFNDHQRVERPATTKRRGTRPRRKDDVSMILPRKSRSERTTTATAAQAPQDNQQTIAPKLAAESFRGEEAEWEEDSGSADAWGSAGIRPPLTAADEVEYSSHVQDLLTLEAKKVELEKQLGRTPTEQEWADHVGISVLRLYARIGRGRAAKRRMVEANLQLVHSVAHQFQGQGLSHTELFHEGVLGLLKSTEKFDSTRRTKFSSYAFFWVKEQMSSAAKKFGRALRIGRNVYATASSLLRHKAAFEVQHGRAPTCDELAEASNVDAKRIPQALRILSPVKSLDAAVDTSESADGRNPLFRQLGDTSPASQPWLCARDMERRTEVIRVLASLKPREQQIMHLRYGLGGEPPLSRSEVSTVLGVTYETIRTTEKGALARLLELATGDGLMEYLNDSLWVD